MTETSPLVCCPRFEPESWDDKSFTWENKLFVKDRVRSFLHMPLNYGAVYQRNLAAIEAANANPGTRLVLSDENSLWGADVYFEVTKEVPGANMATISGTFLTKVFEGPYRNVPRWIEMMKTFIQEKGKVLQKLYVFYTTCPKCAKAYGKNYVVLLGQV